MSSDFDSDYVNYVGSEDEDDFRSGIDSFHEAVIWGTDWTAETINSQLAKGNIELNPKFQRRDAWSKRQKSKFIESLILGLPIPQIILAEKKNKRGQFIVLDGKQRLLTLRQFFSVNEKAGFTPLKLEGLEILGELNGKTFSDISSDLINNHMIDQLMNHSIRTIVIRNWPNESFLYVVFLRLNTGSIRLSPQELRQALHPGEFIDFVDSFATSSDSIKKMLKLKKPDFRMRDNEMVVRYFMFKYFIEDYNGNLKNAFDSTVERLNESWSTREKEINGFANELNHAIDFVIDIFGVKKGFSKWIPGERFQNNFNRAVFDIMTYYFSIKEVRDSLSGRNEEIINAFIQLCENDVEFLTSIELTTKSIVNTGIRLSRWGEIVKGLSGIDFGVPTLVDGYIKVVN